jgi:hypothetical protein
LDADIRSTADILDKLGKHDIADRICNEHAALVAVAEAVKRYKDFSQPVNCEFVEVNKALANLAAVRGE